MISMSESIKKIIAIVVLGTIIMFMVLLSVGFVCEANNKDAVKSNADTLKKSKTDAWDFFFWI